MRAYTRPMRISGMGGEAEQVSALEALPLKAGSEGQFSERWLQMLIQGNPTLLPVDQIEPALVPLVPVCTELPIPSGFVDNLMLTTDGGIVLVETKLWRNPEARREVVGQVLDYAKDLSRWTYSELQRAIRIAAKDPQLDLFRRVAGPDAAPEAEGKFIDAVSRNLRLGRFLLIIAGDGIQESAEHLTDFLQRHVGLHFTLALVEISFWRAPDTGDVFVQPKVVARTLQIERAVVRLEEGVAMTPTRLTPAPSTAKPTSISAEGFYDALRLASPGLPERLQAFLTEAEALGVYADIQRGMTLKWKGPGDRVFRLGHIGSDGRLATDYAHWDAKAVGRIDLSHAYQAKLASAVPGASIRETPNPVGWRMVIGTENPSLALLLDHGDAWLAAIMDYIAGLERALASPETV
ncbi:hypothetical protein [Phenylobacterium sp.]|uniref:hypothetical protein n=1 Tax=Phenylobacterium sp. TaxID=1871053 RepID=UPI0037C6EDE6